MAARAGVLRSCSTPKVFGSIFLNKMELNVLFSPDIPRCLQLGFLIHHQGLHAAVEVNGAEAAAPKKGKFSFCLLSLL